MKTIKCKNEAEAREKLKLAIDDVPSGATVDVYSGATAIDPLEERISLEIETRYDFCKTIFTWESDNDG